MKRFYVVKVVVVPLEEGNRLLVAVELAMILQKWEVAGMMVVVAATLLQTAFIWASLP